MPIVMIEKMITAAGFLTFPTGPQPWMTGADDGGGGDVGVGSVMAGPPGLANPASLARSGHDVRFLGWGTPPGASDPVASGAGDGQLQLGDPLRGVLEVPLEVQ